MLAAAALVGCSSSESEPTPSLTLTGESVSLFSSGLSVPAAATEVTLTFQSGASWMAFVDETKALASWVVPTPSYGKGGDVTLVLAILANDTQQSRSATLSITSGDLVKTLSIAQAGRAGIPITSLILSKEAVSFYPGQTLSLRATVLPSNTDEDKTVSWSSSNAAVVTVEEGLLTAIAPGEAKVTAKAGSHSATCAVTVLRRTIEVESVVVTPEEVEVKAGKTVQLSATVLPENADDKSLSWSTSDVAVATVDEQGLVTAVGAGTTIITVTAASGKRGICTITVRPAGNSGEDLDGSTDVDPWK